MLEFLFTAAISITGAVVILGYVVAVLLLIERYEYLCSEDEETTFLWVTKREFHSALIIISGLIPFVVWPIWEIIHRRHQKQVMCSGAC